MALLVRLIPPFPKTFPMTSLSMVWRLGEGLEISPLIRPWGIPPLIPTLLGRVTPLLGLLPSPPTPPGQTTPPWASTPSPPILRERRTRLSVGVRRVQQLRGR